MEISSLLNSGALSRILLYNLRDRLTAFLLVTSLLIDLSTPWMCFEAPKQYRQDQYILVNLAYFMQVLCALVLMLSTLYSGLQMKRRLVASLSPSSNRHMFRVVVKQVEIIVTLSSASFFLQVGEEGKPQQS